MPLATARAIVEAWETVIDSQAWRREMWRCPRVPRVLRIALEEEQVSRLHGKSSAKAEDTVLRGKRRENWSERRQG